MPPLLTTDIFSDFPHQLREGINPYVTRLKNSRSDPSLPIFYGEQLKDKAGMWSQNLSSTMNTLPGKLVLEIGVHKGAVFCEMARRTPDWGFIGMDITMKRVVWTAEKIRKQQLNNACVLLGNATHLERIFDNNELDGVVIFFPDPWNKKEHQSKNRLLQKSFCDALQSRLKPGGFFWFKTDVKSYFEETCSFFSNMTRESERPFGENIVSAFEERFQREGRPTFEVVFRQPLSFPSKIL